MQHSYFEIYHWCLYEQFTLFIMLSMLFYRHAIVCLFICLWIFGLFPVLAITNKTAKAIWTPNKNKWRGTKVCEGSQPAWSRSQHKEASQKDSMCSTTSVTQSKTFKTFSLYLWLQTPLVIFTATYSYYQRGHKNPLSSWQSMKYGVTFRHQKYYRKPIQLESMVGQ